MLQRFSSALTKVPSILIAVLILAAGASAAPKLRVLHAFGSGSDGLGLWASLVLDSEGNLYGTTSGGGADGYGTVFELTPTGDGTWQERVIRSFSFDDPAGYEPMSTPTLDAAGNLYATTLAGGAHEDGTVFELAYGTWQESVLYNFCSRPACTDGAAPSGGLIWNHGSDLYGTADYPFALSRELNGWKETVLHHFTCHKDGCGAVGGVARDDAGNLYGVTAQGGTGGCAAPGCGTAYELQPMPDGSWREITIHEFGTEHFPLAHPGGPLLVDSQGNVYGTADGGAYHNGAVFRLSQSSGRWKLTVVYDFPVDADGIGATAGLITDKAGNLYGVAATGGDPNCYCGAVYKLSPAPKGSWKYTVLHRFVGYDGFFPDATLILDVAGNLYGTTMTGGIFGGGVAFELSP